MKTSGKKGIACWGKEGEAYVYDNLRRTDQVFHLKLKHVLGGVSLLSPLAVFEVFSILAASEIIELFVPTKSSAAEIWFGTAVLTGFAELYLHREGQENYI